MKGHLIGIFASVSLALCVAMLPLWCRSYRHWDHVSTVNEKLSPAGAKINAQPAMIVFSHGGSLTIAHAMFDSMTGRFGLPPGRRVEIPYLSILGASLLLPVMWSAGWLRRHSPPSRTGRCMNCGYDMRATPDRCPECGLVAAKVA